MKTPEEENANNAEETQEGTQTTPTARQSFLDIYKKHYPDAEGEPDEEAMYGHANRGWAERDEMEGKYNHLNELNEKLAKPIGEDPRFAQFIAMVANGENPMYSLGKCFGNLLDHLDDESLEELKRGQEEYKSRFATAKTNFENYTANLKAYATENGLTPEDTDKLDNAIMDIADAFADRDIPTEILKIVWEGMNAEENAQANYEAGKTDGANEAIDDMKGNKATPSPMADLGGGGTAKPAKRIVPVSKPQTLASAFKEREDV